MDKQFSETDRIRLAEAFHMAEQLTEKVWNGWQVPFAVLLVTPETEWLIRHPDPSPDFTSQGNDDLLKSTLYTRPSVFPSDLLASFPAVNDVSTIVVGQAENTHCLTSSPWVMTLLHEHFHQWQDSQPGMYEASSALNLSRGDTTGMWMLNYAFPYDDPALQERFKALTAVLSKSLSVAETSDFSSAVAQYRRAQTLFREGLLPDDWKYFQFQLWKEGVARYTEYRVAELAAAEYTPTQAFCDVEDFTPYSEVRDDLKQSILGKLPHLDLGTSQRSAFYAVGAAEALLLDRVNPSWQTRYFEDKFEVDGYFPEG